VTTMEREGAIRRIDVGDGKAYYEVGEEHHEHVRCDSCGRVAEVPGCVLDDATAGVQKSTGFVVTSHQLVFGGLCPRCSESRARAWFDSGLTRPKSRAGSASCHHFLRLSWARGAVGSASVWESGGPGFGWPRGREGSH